MCANIQDRMAEIIAAHSIVGTFTAGYLAQAIVDELGLCEEVNPNAPISVAEYDSDGEPIMDDRLFLPVHKHHIEWVTKRRWVTKWEQDE